MTKTEQGHIKQCNKPNVLLLLAWVWAICSMVLWLLWCYLFSQLPSKMVCNSEQKIIIMFVLDSVAQLKTGIDWPIIVKKQTNKNKTKTALYCIFDLSLFLSSPFFLTISVLFSGTHRPSSCSGKTCQFWTRNSVSSQVPFHAPGMSSTNQLRVGGFRLCAVIKQKDVTSHMATKRSYWKVELGLLSFTLQTGLTHP